MILDVFDVNRASIAFKKLPNQTQFYNQNFSEFHLHYLNCTILYSVLPSFRYQFPAKKSKLGYFRWDFNSSSPEGIRWKKNISGINWLFGGLFGRETSEQEGILLR